MFVRERGLPRLDVMERGSWLGGSEEVRGGVDFVIVVSGVSWRVWKER